MPKQTTPKRNKTPSSVDTPAHYNAVLMEEIRSQMGLVIEKVESVEVSLSRRMDEKFAKVDEDLRLLKSVTREHSHQLHRLDQKIDRVESALTERIDRVETTLTQVDAKVDKIGKRLDHVESRVDQHDVILADRG